MISVDEAQQAVITEASPPMPVPGSISESQELVLAEEIVSDLDLPPFDKALVDGFAIRSADLSGNRGCFSVVGEIFAGMAPWSSDRALGAGEAARIMTGAPIPPGADAVVMVERTESKRTETGGLGVAIDDSRFRPGQNIMRRGAEMRCGEVVLRAGARLRPAELGVLAAVGRTAVSVYRRPRVAIISTGDELVDFGSPPGPGQIRNSNGPLLVALAARAGARAQSLGIARDNQEDLDRLIRAGLESDILLLSGGVSAGDLDLVPGVLQALGVRQIFHKVNLKPGKPIWFGIRDGASDRTAGGSDAPGPTLVFGLPGNPVSVMVCFELFVRPAIRRLMGFENPSPPPVTAALAEAWDSRTDRATYWPAWVESTDAGWSVRLVSWKGSPDLRATTAANGFAIFPSGDNQYRRGDRIQVLMTEY